MATKKPQAESDDDKAKKPKSAKSKAAKEKTESKAGQHEPKSESAASGPPMGKSKLRMSLNR